MAWQAVVSRTFIEVKEDTEISDSHRRARSLEALRVPREEHQVTVDSLQRLNELLACPASRVEALPPVARQPWASEDGPSVDELRALQRRLAELASPSIGPKHLCHQRVMSTSSVSTMAPDCDDEYEGSHRYGMHHVRSSGSVSSMASQQLRMPKVWSSGSVSSMVSDFVLEEVPEEGHHFGPIFEEAVDDCRERSDKSKIGMAPKVEFSHSRVPKNINLEEAFKTSPEGPPTTMMIRNIPNRYTQKELIRELEGLGFQGSFDFFYMPMDKATMCNVGYAFINFLQPEVAQRCMVELEKYSFKKHKKALNRNKLATVSVAHLQGLEANVRHYANAAVTGANTGNSKQMRGPVIMTNVAQAVA